MFCNRCGKTLPEDQVASYCDNCASVVSQKKKEEFESKKITKDRNDNDVMGYAGFWLRFLAYGLDGVIISTFSIIALYSYSYLLTSFDFSSSASIFYFTAIMALPCLYSIVFEISPLQATLGKRFLGLIVTNGLFAKSSFWAILFRNLAKFYFESILFLIILCFAYFFFFTKPNSPSLAVFAELRSCQYVLGIVWLVHYAMAGFTADKQALHDLIAKTYVVRKTNPNPAKILVSIIVIVVMTIVSVSLYSNLKNSMRQKIQNYYESTKPATNSHESKLELDKFIPNTNITKTRSPSENNPPSIIEENTPTSSNQSLEHEEEQIKAIQKPTGILLEKDQRSLRYYHSLSKSINEMERRDGLKGFERYGALAKDYLPSIIAALSDRSELVQLAAIKALGKFGAEGSPAITELQKALKSKNVALSSAAAQTLEQIGTPEAVAAVKK